MAAMTVRELLLAVYRFPLDAVVSAVPLRTGRARRRTAKAAA